MNELQQRGEGRERECTRSHTPCVGGGVPAGQLLYETNSTRGSLSLGTLVFLWKVGLNLGKHQAIQVKGFRSQKGPLELLGCIMLDAPKLSEAPHTLPSAPKDSVRTDQTAEGEGRGGEPGI